ncbi:hypothetical protein [Auraticoccus monumenti]|uniref:Uncharacterized protein n=1 Tax=Auraticoccus monumenti TaxID=675864 RepID=A0A1G6ULB1_9ACTN|nr:hypothetical protein [Auraticoccus monumenti]SDD42132.1 hypothetical protein SAMN04489747_0913 [Auraticoccus monumenti]
MPGDKPAGWLLDVDRLRAAGLPVPSDEADRHRLAAAVTWGYGTGLAVGLAKDDRPGPPNPYTRPEETR